MDLGNNADMVQTQLGERSASKRLDSRIAQQAYPDTRVWEEQTQIQRERVAVSKSTRGLGTRSCRALLPR